MDVDRRLFDAVPRGRPRGAAQPASAPEIDRDQVAERLPQPRRHGKLPRRSRPQCVLELPGQPPRTQLDPVFVRAVSDMGDVDRTAQVLDQRLHTPVVSGYQRGESGDPLGAGSIGQAPQHQLPHPAALPIIGYGDRCLGPGGVPFVAYESGDGDTPASHGIDRAQRLVIVTVDLGQVPQLGGAERRLGSQEPQPPRLCAQAGKPLGEHGRVVGRDAPDQELGAVRKCGSLAICSRPRAVAASSGSVNPEHESSLTYPRHPACGGWHRCSLRDARTRVTLALVRLWPDRPLGVAPATVHDYRELARRRLPRQLFDYIDGGAYDEATMRANVADLEHYKLRQIVLRDVSSRDTAVRVLGQPLSLPVLLAPVGLGGMFSTRAEVQAARAAQREGAQFIESTLSVCGLEEVTGAIPDPPWFQLYVMRDRGYAEALMARATSVKAPVLVLTVDLAVVGARYRDVRNAAVIASSTRAKVIRTLDLVSHARWIRDVPGKGRPLTFGNLESAVPKARTPAAFRQWVDEQFDPSVTWEDIAWVREHWQGPLVLKGILDPEDARRAADLGVEGLIVSNHGGRQLDSVPSTVRALPDVVEAVGDQLEVLVDGGVRTGLDVVKMIALGARAVLIGRPWAWAVAARGEAGVRHILKVLKADMDVALALTGNTSIADVDRSALYKLDEVRALGDPPV